MMFSVNQHCMTNTKHFATSVTFISGYSLTALFWAKFHPRNHFFYVYYLRLNLRWSMNDIWYFYRLLLSTLSTEFHTLHNLSTTIYAMFSFCHLNIILVTWILCNALEWDRELRSTLVLLDRSIAFWIFRSFYLIL